MLMVGGLYSGTAARRHGGAAAQRRSGAGRVLRGASGRSLVVAQLEGSARELEGVEPAPRAEVRLDRDLVGGAVEGAEGVSALAAGGREIDGRSGADREAVCVLVDLDRRAAGPQLVKEGPGPPRDADERVARGVANALRPSQPARPGVPRGTPGLAGPTRAERCDGG